MDLFDLVPVIFGAAGLLFAAKGVRRIVSTHRFEKRAARAGGEVTAVRERWVSSSSGYRNSSRWAYVPVVRFTAADGRLVEAETADYTTFRRHESGDPIEVLYDPGDPSDVRLPSGAGSMLSSAFTVVFGLVFAVLAVVMFGGLGALDL